MCLGIADVRLRMHLGEYAAHLARLSSTDTVELRAFGVDGSEVSTTVVLNSGTPLVIESTDSTLPEPDNAGAVAYVVAQMGQFDIDAVVFGCLDTDG